MSAESVLADAVLAGVRDALGDQVNGVFDGPAVKATAPWIELGPLVAADWSTKDKAGREVRLVLTVRDRAERPARTHTLAADAGAAVEAVPRDLTGWRIASCAFVRARVFGDARSRGLIDLKFFVEIDGNTTVDGLRAAAHKAENAIRNGHVVDFIVDDEGMVAPSLNGLLYN